MPTIRRGFALVLCFALAVCLAVPAAAMAELPLASEAAILMDADTGQILYEKNCHQRMYPASITKVMTGMLALRELDTKQIITVSQEAVDAVPRTSSHIALVPGEKLTVEDAVRGLAMVSGNDAANVLAEAVSGSLEDFAIKMTETARELGALDTNFTNANGLPNAEHYTTAYDMAKICAAALKVPHFADYFSTHQYYFAPTNQFPETRYFENPNQILFGPYAYQGVLMSKTGWTSSALGTLVTAAEQNGVTLIAVVLKSQLLESKYQDTCMLFDYGFSQYRKVTAAGEQLVALLPGGFQAAPGQEVSLLMPDSMELQDITLSLPEGQALPAKVGQQDQVTLNACLGALPLPDITLTVTKTKNVPASLPVTSEETIAAPDAPGSAWKLILVTVILGLLLLLCCVGAYLKWKHPTLIPSLLKRLREQYQPAEEETPVP